MVSASTAPKQGAWQRAAWRAETSGLGEIHSRNGSASDPIKSKLQDGKRSLNSGGVGWGNGVKDGFYGYDENLPYCTENLLGSSPGGSREFEGWTELVRKNLLI